MQFTKGARVYSAEQRRVGWITRVVLNPTTKKVSDIVIRRGAILAAEKIVPIEHFHDAFGEQAILRDGVGDVQNLPNFQEIVYTPVEFAHDGGTVVPTAADTSLSAFRNEPERRYVKHIKQNIPDDTIALREGSPVTSEDNHRVGHVESVSVDSQTGNILNFVIARGLLRKARRCVPALWCDIVAEDEVRVKLDAQGLEALPEYELSPTGSWNGF